jgi:hypothetical protein
VLGDRGALGAVPLPPCRLGCPRCRSSPSHVPPLS